MFDWYDFNIGWLVNQLKSLGGALVCVCKCALHGACVYGNREKKNHKRQNKPYEYTQKENQYTGAEPESHRQKINRIVRKSVSVCVILVIKNIILINFYSQCSSVVKPDSSIAPFCTGRTKTFFTIHHIHTHDSFLCMCLFQYWYSHPCAFLFEKKKVQRVYAIGHLSTTTRNKYINLSQKIVIFVRYVRICFFECLYVSILNVHIALSSFLICFAPI